MKPALISGESELKARMLLQTSWISGEGVAQLSLVHLALSILNRVLLHKDCVKVNVVKYLKKCLV